VTTAAEIDREERPGILAAASCGRELELTKRPSNSFTHEAFGVLFEDTTVLDYNHARLAGALGGFFMDHSFLHPHDLRTLADGTFHDVGNGVRPAKDYHHFGCFRDVI
jgi:hypothetical protein